MKKLVLAMAALAALGVLAAVDLTPKGICTWIGPATGGNWEDEANWSTDSRDYTVAQLLATNAVYIVSSLADGAVLTNNMEDRPICGVTNTAVGTITFQGKNFLWRHPTQTEINLGSGSKIIWRMCHPNNWNSKDTGTKVVISGSGTLSLDPTSSTGISFYEREIQPCHSTTLEIGSNCWFNLTFVRQWNNSTVRLIGKDITVAQLISTQSGCSLDLNGNNLFIAGGEHAYKISSSEAFYAGTVLGTGNITVSGGQTYTINGTWSNSGYLALSTASLQARAGFNMPATVEPIANGRGTFIFPGDQTLYGLRGNGVTGGVKMQDGTTLTLDKGPLDVSSFAGRIVGDNVVKKGNFTQVFTGDNAYTGSTTVTEGTLIVRRPIARKGLVAYWPFDDTGDDMGRDYGPNGLNLSFTCYGSAVATQRVDGVRGRPALDLATGPDGTGAARYQCTGLTRAAGFPTGNDAVSVSFWAKPRSKKNHAYLFRYGDWGGTTTGKQLTLWTMGTKVITCIVNWNTNDSDNSPVYTADDLYDGNWHHFAITYATNHLSVYYDGALKNEKTCCNLDIPGTTTLIFGNNDSKNAHYYYGGIDEAAVYNYELSAAEVAAEYARVMPGAENPADVIPEPLCHWAFDDASAPGKDTMGRADLVANPSVSTTPVISSGALKSDTSMVLASASQPDGFPSGKDPFTVSVRLNPGGPYENWDVLHFGDMSTYKNNDSGTVTNGFRIYYYSCPRRLRVVYGGKAVNVNHSNTSTSDPDAWTHLVVTCDPVTRLMRVFRDGRLETTVTDVNVNTFLRPGMLRLNTKPDGTRTTGVAVDDLRIFKGAMSPGDVYMLSRSLQTGVVGPVLATNSTMTVASGATLTVEGLGHGFKSLAGEGTVLLRGPARLEAADTEAFTGSITGPGTLVVAAPVTNATVSSEVELLSNGVFNVASLPVVTTTGHLKVPSAGQIAFEGRPTETSYVIARGVTADGADGYTNGWTTSLSPAQVSVYRPEFTIENGEFLLKLTRGPLTIIFR